MEESKRNPIWPLIFLTHSCAGLFFAYETPGSLAPDLKDNMGFTPHQIGLLYSAYSIPAIISIFTNNYLRRRFGLSKCLAMFSFVVALGTFIVAIAPNFPTMLAGQLLYGAGSSPMTLTASTITGKWFGSDAKGKKRVSLAMGLEFAWLRFGSFGALFLLPVITRATNYRVGLVTSALVCASSFAAGLIFYIVDARYKYTTHLFNETETKEVELDKTKEKIVKIEEGKGKDTNTKQLEQNMYILSPASERKLEARLDLEDEPGAAILNVKLKKTTNDEDEDDEAGLVVDKNNKKHKKEETKEKESGSEEENKKLLSKIKESIRENYYTLKGFSASYWLVVALMSIFMSDLYTCTAFLTDYLYESKLVSSATKASEITSLVCLANVLTSPLAGWLSGYTGWKVKYVILGSLNLVLIHCLLTFAATTISPIIMACALGLTQSIMDTNLWPSLVYTVSHKDYAFAMSICTIMYNVGLIIFPSFVGMLQDATGSWLSVNLSFIMLSAVSVLVAIVLKLVDISKGNLLDSVQSDFKSDKIVGGHH